MKILVLGYGSMGRRRARQATSLGHDVRIYDPASVISIDATEADAWAWDPDVAVISSPISAHFTQMVEAANREIPFFVEKPIALDSQIGEVKEFVAALNKVGGQVAQVGYNLRHHDGIAKLLDRLKMRLKMVGRSGLAQFTMHCDKSRWPGTYEDMLLEASHEIDLALYLLGPAQLISAGGRGGRWLLELKHDSGSASVISLDGAKSRYERKAIFVGDPSVSWGWNAESIDDGHWMVKSDDHWYGGYQSAEDTLTIDFASFFQHLTGGTCPPCGLDEGLAVLEICAAARSMASAVGGI